MIQIILMIFGLMVLYAWKRSDVKRGKVKNIYLIAPLVFLPFIGMRGFLLFFLPLFVMLFFIRKITRNKIGFADVVALPFAFFFLSCMHPMAMAAFAGVLAFFSFMYRRMYPKRMRIIFIPIIFMAFAFALLAHAFITFGPITLIVLFCIILVYACVRAGVWLADTVMPLMKQRRESK